ncbi:helix-turn-helix transcriptional regulator [Chloroflexota bacterium]
MSVNISGGTYYRTAEVCRMIGISRNTLFRWLQQGRFGKTEHRDIRGWRLFTQGEIDKAILELNRITKSQRLIGKK